VEHGNLLLICTLAAGYRLVTRKKRTHAVPDKEGYERLGGAIALGQRLEHEQAVEGKTKILHTVLAGTVPATQQTDKPIRLGRIYRVALYTSGLQIRDIVLPKRHVQPSGEKRPPEAWGTFQEVKAALALVRDTYNCPLVFVTSWYHIPRVRVACWEILGGKELRQLERRGLLRFEGVRVPHPRVKNLFTEPLKILAQLLRVRFGQYLPETLSGRL
jgi:hypothetical protein